MAIIKYDSFGSDLLKVRFKCCKHRRESALICPEFSTGKHSCRDEVKAMCGCKYKVYVEVQTFTTTINILELPQEDIISWHPIWWEYYTVQNTECVDWIVESVNIERCMEATAQLDKRNSAFIYEMLWCRIISMMDAYCHHAVAHRVLSDREKWNSFYEVRNKGKSKEKWIKGEIDTILQQTTFLSIDFIVEVLDKVFGISVVPDENLSHAVHIRNVLVHTQGFGMHREKYMIEKNELHNLFKSVNTFISDINKCLLNYDAEQMMRRMDNRQSNSLEKAYER